MMLYFFVRFAVISQIVVRWLFTNRCTFKKLGMLFRNGMN